MAADIRGARRQLARSKVNNMADQTILDVVIIG
jgi:hypothetical protein